MFTSTGIIPELFSLRSLCLWKRWRMSFNMKLIHHNFLILFWFLPQAARLQVTDWDREAVRLEEQRLLWKSHEIHRYSLQMEMDCFGCYGFFPVTILVYDDKIVALLNPETG